MRNRSFRPRIRAQAGAGGVAHDPFFSSTKLLLHFDGTDAQTTTVDSSAAAHTITAIGGQTLSTAQAKFGTASSLSSGTTATRCWNSAYSTDWAFGSGQFTVEAQIYLTGTAPGFANVVGQWTGVGGFSGWYLAILSGALTFGYSTTGSNNPGVGATWTPTTNTWYSIAADRDASNVVRVYVNGAVLASATVSGALYNPSTGLSVAGCNGTSLFGIPGYVDEVRITNGVARYAGAYTPATSAFPNQ